MTKTERLRRDRADRKELRELRHYKSRTEWSGVHLAQINLGEVTHSKLNTATLLDHTLVLKWSREQTWNVSAVRR